ncbi:MAG: hypothetical protein JSR80_05570 [Verrucomicrobia bacterium]|nr:hypothetical protein [Verrucomicrobiota bacterium]
MTLDVTGKKELASLKFDWKIHQINAASTKCCAGGTRDVTARHAGAKRNSMNTIPTDHDGKDAKSIALSYGYLRN